MRTFATSPRNLYVSLRTNRPFIGTLNVLKAQLLQALFEEYGAAGADTSRLKPFFQRLAYRHTDTLRSRIYVLSFFFFLFRSFSSFFFCFFLTILLVADKVWSKEFWSTQRQQFGRVEWQTGNRSWASGWICDKTTPARENIWTFSTGNLLRIIVFTASFFRLIIVSLLSF